MPHPLEGYAFAVQDRRAVSADCAKDGGSRQAEELAQVCRDFESLFIHHMLREMRKTVPQEGLFNGGTAEQLYRDMLDSEMAKQISKQGGIGLAPILHSQMLGRIQEKK